MTKLYELLLLGAADNKADGAGGRMSWTTATRIRAVLCLCTCLLSLAGLDLLDFAGQVFVGGQDFAQLYKGADDENVHLHSTRTIKHGREHGHAVLGKGIGKKARVAMLLGTGRNLRPVQDFNFIGSGRRGYAPGG